MVKLLPVKDNQVTVKFGVKRSSKKTHTHLEPVYVYLYLVVYTLK